MARPEVTLTPRLVVAALIYFALKTVLTVTCYLILLDLFVTEWPQAAIAIRYSLRFAWVIAFVLYALRPLVVLLVFRRDLG